MSRLFVGVALMGGLGNQMFQYAAGYALAKRLDATLRLDLSHFNNSSLRSYRLEEFDIEATYWDSPSLTVALRRHLHLAWQRANRYGLLPKPSLHLLQERSFHVAEDFFTISSNCYIHGYWQSPKYFQDVSREIRDAFRFDRFGVPHVVTLPEGIWEGPTVSVHFRRGDYLEPQTAAYHGLCETEYYLRARDLLLRCEPNARFLVFSDDLTAARQVFEDWPRTFIVSGTSDMDDMRLMSRCNHHIIANSSFSWWAAWLDDRPDSLVVAPRNWFARPVLLRTHVLDLFPAHWILL